MDGAQCFIDFLVVTNTALANGLIRAMSKSFVTLCFLLYQEAFIMLYPDEYVNETSESYGPKCEI